MKTVAILAVSLLAVLLLITLAWGCQPRDSEDSCRPKGTWEDLRQDAWGIVGRLEAYRLDNGTVPDSLADAGISRNTLHYPSWRYMRRGPRSFYLSGGNHDFYCDWSAHLLYEVGWNEDRAGGIEPTIVEHGETLIASLLAQNRELGTIAYGLDEIGIGPPWGDHAPWVLQNWTTTGGNSRHSNWHGRLIPTLKEKPIDLERPYLTFRVVWGAREK